MATGKTLDGLWPPFAHAVQAMLDDPEGVALGLYVVSGFRSVGYQAILFADAVRRYGSETAARKWVAPPGRSNHGPKVDGQGREPGPYGRAVDLGVPGFPAVQGKWPTRIRERVDRLAARYGLFSPLSNEDWHFQPGPTMSTDVPTTPGVAMAVFNLVAFDLVPGGTPDPQGRLPFWGVDAHGNLYAFNGAPSIKGLYERGDRTHSDVFGLKALSPTSVVAVADDGHTEDEVDADGATRPKWKASTFKMDVD